MKTTINEYQFRQEFINYGRENNFSYEGLTALFEYFEDYENDTGQEIELDVIAICCEYTEDSIEYFKNCYNLDDSLSNNDVIDWLTDRTQVIELDNDNIIIAEF